MTNNELQKPDAPDPDQNWQDAVTHRLTKLRTMPVELAALEARVNARDSAPAPAASSRGSQPGGLRKPSPLVLSWSWFRWV